ncbi:MAG: hypothetical protein FWD71_05185 [Oscillospiraceae bacterium]|nr:hypothetical protein [Oscillospiraceae bacterium]
MKTHAKLLSAAMAFILSALAFTGCSSSNSQNTAATDTSLAPTISSTVPPTTAVPTTTAAPTTPAPTQPPPTFADAVVLDCTKIDYNKLGSVKVQSATPDPPAGETAYWYSRASIGDVVLQAVIPPFDATQNNYMTGALKVEVWCNDITLMGGSDSQFEFSTTTCDVDENAWNWKNQVTQNGWNTVYLPWDQASVTGDPDYSALTWLRIYDVGRTCDYAIGSIYVVPLSEVPPDVIKFLEAMM